jgi:hypothetical protein
MAILSHKCPHCLVEAVGLHVVHCSNKQNKRFVSLVCPKCKMPSAAELLNHHATSDVESLLQNTGGDILDFGWIVHEFWPEPPKPSIPENLPPDVERVYLQAERNFPIDGNEEAAGTMYGKALDVGLKKIDPSLSGMLGPRIKKLALAGKLTSDIAEWSDNIRDIRNDAVHEETPISRSELTELRNFSEMVLRYLFTLPGAVKKRRGEKLPWE